MCHISRQAYLARHLPILPLTPGLGALLCVLLAAVSPWKPNMPPVPLAPPAGHPQGARPPDPAVQVDRGGQAAAGPPDVRGRPGAWLAVGGGCAPACTRPVRASKLPGWIALAPWARRSLVWAVQLVTAERPGPSLDVRVLGCERVCVCLQAGAVHTASFGMWPPCLLLPSSPLQPKQACLPSQLVRHRRPHAMPHAGACNLMQFKANLLLPLAWLCRWQSRRGCPRATVL